VRIRPGFYPRGARGGFFPHQEVVIHDILAELDGVVRWGGDDRTPDESLFSVDVRPGDQRPARVAARIRGRQLEPGAGAGSPVKVLAGGRRKAARAPGAPATHRGMTKGAPPRCAAEPPRSCYLVKP
jgi:hypothetical protein